MIVTVRDINFVVFTDSDAPWIFEITIASSLASKLTEEVTLQIKILNTVPAVIDDVEPLVRSNRHLQHAIELPVPAARRSEAFDEAQIRRKLVDDIRLMVADENIAVGIDRDAMGILLGALMGPEVFAPGSIRRKNRDAMVVKVTNEDIPICDSHADRIPKLSISCSIRPKTPREATGGVENRHSVASMLRDIKISG